MLQQSHLKLLLIRRKYSNILEGKVIQYGKTLDVYNKPNTLVSAQVFSDPPMNIAKIKKSGDQLFIFTKQNSMEDKTKY